MVESHFNKGWYLDFNPLYNSGDYEAPGYQYDIEQAHHFFGRFFPKKPEAFKNWQEYTSVGKVSWMWQAVYKAILEDISKLDNVLIVRTEQISYEHYCQICDFLAIAKAGSKEFQEVVNDKPGKAVYNRIPDWNDNEISEFEMLTMDVFELLEKHPSRLSL